MIFNCLMISEQSISMSMFEPAYVGIPLAVAGMAYLLLVGRRLLPDGRSAFSTFENTREYTIEMIVKGKSPLVGKSIENAGLRNLPGLFLVEIYKIGRVHV